MSASPVFVCLFVFIYVLESLFTLNTWFCNSVRLVVLSFFFSLTYVVREDIKVSLASEMYFHYNNHFLVHEHAINAMALKTLLYFRRLCAAC